MPQRLAAIWLISLPVESSRRGTHWGHLAEQVVPMAHLGAQHCVTLPQAAGLLRNALALVSVDMTSGSQIDVTAVACFRGMRLSNRTTSRPHA